MAVQGTAVDDPEQQMTRKPDDKEPLAGLAFKIMADQFQVCTHAPLHSVNGHWSRKHYMTC